ncbi:hypothetical protein B0H14DRAFT_3126275 [Mycena olivaceomarginata]|nr:hypothetical protein B0H14DRAFT_3126275 [Mycena olivaceomarginata]
MHHVRLVRFAWSLKNTYMFRNIATLVLGDLDHTAAPSVDKLYGVLPEASGLEDLSIGRIDRTDPLSSLETLVPMQLKKLHIYTAGNEAVEVFLQLIRAPSLLQLDVKLLCDRDWSALLKFGELVRPVVALCIYDLVSASTIMPEVRMLDVTTADRALARCAVLKEFKWTKWITMDYNLVAEKVILITVEPCGAPPGGWNKQSNFGSLGFLATSPTSALVNLSKEPLAALPFSSSFPPLHHPRSNPHPAASLAMISPNRTHCKMQNTTARHFAAGVLPLRLWFRRCLGHLRWISYLISSLYTVIKATVAGALAATRKLPPLTQSVIHYIFSSNLAKACRVFT